MAMRAAKTETSPDESEDDTGFSNRSSLVQLGQET